MDRVRSEMKFTEAKYLKIPYKLTVVPFLPSCDHFKLRFGEEKMAQIHQM